MYFGMSSKRTGVKALLSVRKYLCSLAIFDLIDTLSVIPTCFLTIK